MKVQVYIGDQWSAAETAGLGVLAAWWWSLKHFVKMNSEGRENREFFGIPDWQP